MRTVKALDGQGLYDIAMQKYGSIDGAVFLVKDNDGLSINSRLVAGQVLKLRDVVLDAAVINYFEKNNVSPVNGIGVGEVVVSGFDEGFDEGFGSGGSFNGGFGSGFDIGE